MSDLQPNPYAPAVVTTPQADNDVEAVRRRYLSHEASIKSIGGLFLLGGLLGLALGGMWIAVGIGVMGGPPSPPKPNQPPEIAVRFLAFGLIALLLSVGQLVAAVGLRALKPWSRIPAAILAGIGLLGFPLGTLINGYVLYLLLSAKGTMVFSPQYQNVMAQTKHIKYKTSIIAWIFLGILVALILFGIIGGIASGA